MFNVVSLVLVVCALGVVSEKTGRSLVFPFSAPVGYLVDVPSSFTRQQDFDHFCFKYVYGVVKLFSHNSKIDTLSDQLSSLCREKDHSRCKRWAAELQEIVDAKKGPTHAQKSHGKPPHSYQSWCSEVYKESAGVAETEQSVAQANSNTHNIIESRKASQTQAPHGLARSSRPTESSHGSSVASKVSSARHVMQNKPVQPRHATVVKSLPQHASVEHAAAKHASPKAEPVQKLHQDSDRSSTKAEDSSKKDECACVHRDSKEICHCVGDEEKKVASLAAQHLGDIITGYAIAIKAKALHSQDDMDGAMDSLSKALSSASHLEATK